MVDFMLGLAFVALVLAPVIVATLIWRKANGGDL
jgi:hypothetical protein